LFVNLDLQKTRTFDDMELPGASTADWGTSITPVTAQGWSVLDLDADFGTGSAWRSPDNGSPATAILTTPQFTVGTSFALTFDHFFSFEPTFDGGVIEISVDGGRFRDAITFYGAAVPTANGYNGTATAFSATGRPAFTGTNGGMETVTLDFGTQFAGHKVQVRFHQQSDEFVGDYGWVVDNVHLNGANAPVFSTAVAEDNVCASTNHAPTANAGADFSVNEGAVANLLGSATDADGDPLTFAWTQVSGPTVAIVNGTTLTPHFTAPMVTADTPVTLRLTVSDGIAQTTDDVVVTVHNVASGGGGGGGGGGALDESALLVATLLAALRRRRRA